MESEEWGVGIWGRTNAVCRRVFIEEETDDEHDGGHPESADEECISASDIVDAYQEEHADREDFYSSVDASVVSSSSIKAVLYSVKVLAP